MGTDTDDIDHQLDASDGFALNDGAVVDRSGSAVRGTGDINGNGIDDLLIGAYRAAPNGNNSSDQSYIIFGRSAPATAPSPPAPPCSPQTSAC